MKILLVNKYATITGGADRHVLDLGEGLSDRGHEVRLLAFRPDHDPPFPGEYVEPTVTSETRGRLKASDMPGLGASLLWNRSAGAAMSRLIDADRPDVVHIHKIYPQISAAPIVVAARRGVPVVQTVHDYEFVSASPADSHGHKLDRTSPSRADRLVNTATFPPRRHVHVPRVTTWIAVSEFVREVHARHGIDAEYVPQFINLAPVAEPRPFAERSGFVFAGRLDFRKGLPEVIELARRAPDVSVTIAGMGPLEEEARRASEELPNLEFLGRLSSDEVRDLFATARVALMPVRWEEPAPLSAFEAMAVGTPIVAFSAGGLGGYIEDSGAGIVVPKDASSEFRDAAVKLHSDERLWSDQSEAGPEAVRARHTLDRYVDSIEVVYRRANSPGNGC